MDKSNLTELVNRAVSDYFAWLDMPMMQGLSVRKSHAVAAFGISPDKNGDKIAVRVWRKQGLHIPAVEMLLAKAGTELDLQVTGQIRVPIRARDTAKSHQERARPLRAGHSVGHHTITAGTLGAFVKSNGWFGGSKPMILSNNHVLAASNSGKVGDAILQPGAHDGGTTEKDVIGTLKEFEVLKENHNLMDAAISTIDRYHPTDYTMPDIGAITNTIVEPKTSIMVQKAGRTTGYTKGKITAINLRGVAVQYGAGMVCRFDNQIEVISDDGLFSNGGDSGSLVVDMDNNPVGLLFAGGGNRTIINPIGPVMKRFNIKFM